MTARALPPGQTDTIEVADLARTVRRQWRALLVCVAIGILAALAIILFAPKRYDGRASVLVRTGGGSGTSVLGRMTGVGDLLGGMGSLTGASAMETELQMLRSRALIGQVVDSLRLQVLVREPARMAAQAIVAAYRLDGSFPPRELTFVRSANGSYQVSGQTDAVPPGAPLKVDVGTITLAKELPATFTIAILDREDAISLFSSQLDVTKAGGEVARIVYQAGDSLTASSAANTLIAFYLERRRTVDRGINQRRVEYVSAQADSAAIQLAAAERELRLSQERGQLFDAEISAEAQLTSAAKIREALIELEVDDAALKQLLERADRGLLTSRDLVAFPTFMKGSAVSPLVTQLTDLEIQRNRLLERRTEKDPEVLALDNSIRAVNGSIVGLARSYSNATTKQISDYRAQLDRLNQGIMALPATGGRVARLQRDVLRLTQLYTALQAQLVEARLAAISEGGDVRQIDVAVPPRTPSFPNPIFVMGAGTSAGLITGVIAALLLGWFGRWLRDPIEIERAVGINVERLAPDTPLLVAGAAPQRTVLVVPLDDRAQARLVAERVARTATARSLPVTLLDLSNGNAAGASGSVESGVARSIERLEQQDGMLVVQLPLLNSDAAVAALRETRPVLLVAGPGPVDRNRLASAVETLRRINAPCAGIIMSDGATNSVSGDAKRSHV